MTSDDIEHEASVLYNINVLRGLFYGSAGLSDIDRAAGQLAVERIANQQPGNDPVPPRCALPAIPPGTVALIGARSGQRWERADGWAGHWANTVGVRYRLGAILDLEGSVRPVTGRTWSKVDKPDDDDLPQMIDVEGHGRWHRISVDGVLYTDGTSATTMGELMTWGDVTEVLGDA